MERGSRAVKIRTNNRVWIAGMLIAGLASLPIASAAGATLSVRNTSLGKIVVNSNGLTAYFYDLDKPNSGVSACSASCSANWPAITSTSAHPTLIGVKGKVTVLAITKQIAINGRPIYTFIGDVSRGSTKGQGLGGVWFAISPAGEELKPAVTATPSVSPKPTSAPTPSPTPSPTESATTGTYSYSNY